MPYSNNKGAVHPVYPRSPEYVKLNMDIGVFMTEIAIYRIEMKTEQRNENISWGKWRYHAKIYRLIGFYIHGWEESHKIGAQSCTHWDPNLQSPAPEVDIYIFSVNVSLQTGARTQRCMLKSMCILPLISFYLRSINAGYVSVSRPPTSFRILTRQQVTADISEDNYSSSRRFCDVLPNFLVNETNYPDGTELFVWYWLRNVQGIWYEPRHDQTNKMSVRPAKTQISLGIRLVWSKSSPYTQWVAKDPSFLHADSEDSDQTGRMRWTRSHFVGFVMLQLIWHNEVVIFLEKRFNRIFSLTQIHLWLREVKL